MNHGAHICQDMTKVISITGRIKCKFPLRPKHMVLITKLYDFSLFLYECKRCELYSI